MLHHTLKKLAALVPLLTLALAALLPGTAGAASPVLERINDSGVLRVAMSANQPPYTMRSRDNKLIGFDVDLATALATTMNVRLELVPMPFGDLLEGVVQGRADVAISGISITPERARSVTFIGPYVLTGKSMLTTKRVREIVTDGTQLNDPEIRIVALHNSTSASFVTRNLPRASLATIGDYDEGVQQLLTGQVDAMVADLPILQLTLLRYPQAELGLVDEPLSTEPIGIAIANGDPQLENLLRNYLSAFDAAGLTKDLHDKWFEDNSWIALLP